ncbi:hypothetical protein JTE90_001161 [Oedothorax gibbosus]|uniref:Uncharacterized protein n=1 Tax=Oedothorax gibbosus TaxID=931172 RepID=A0AAV6VGS5_9ARAC|nr:hypothetical protein JTE90_001161 [Oedothorax gibbosus]
MKAATHHNGSGVSNNIQITNIHPKPTSKPFEKVKFHKRKPLPTTQRVMKPTEDQLSEQFTDRAIRDDMMRSGVPNEEVSRSAYTPKLGYQRRFPKVH